MLGNKWKISITEAADKKILSASQMIAGQFHDNLNNLNVSAQKNPLWQQPCWARSDWRQMDRVWVWVRVCVRLCVSVRVCVSAAAVCSLWSWRSKHDLWPDNLATSHPPLYSSHCSWHLHSACNPVITTVGRRWLLEDHFILASITRFAIATLLYCKNIISINTIT